MSLRTLVRPDLARLEAYSAAEQVSDTIRLNANESSWHLDGDDFRRPLNRYPEIRPAKLKALLSARFGCPRDSLLVTRGSSEAIDLLIRVFCRSGQDSILIARPTFSMYEHYALIQGAGVQSIDLNANEGFVLDPDALLAASDETTKLIFLCSPNNPTGTSIQRSTITQILDETVGECAVVVDEAYIEYSESQSCASLLQQYEHLVVLRTLSKALAFAGARCGGVIGNPEIIGVLDAVQAPYALATPVVECVEDALQSQLSETAEQEVALTIAERERTRASLEDLAIVSRTWPSDANFLLVEFSDVDAVMDATRKEGILLRGYGSSLPGCIRISIGTPAENTALLGVLKAMESA